MSTSFGPPEVAVDELLLGAPRRRVNLRRVIELGEIVPELRAKRPRAEAQHVEPAAPFRALRTEGRDHDVAAGPHGRSNDLDVPAADLRIDQKVKRRAIVPK